VTSESVALAVLPLFHITGLVCVLHACIYAGSTIVIMPRWDRELASQLVTRHSVSHWTCIPTMIVDLMGSPNLDQYDFSSLVYLGGGGSAMLKLSLNDCSNGSGSASSRLWPHGIVGSHDFQSLRFTEAAMPRSAIHQRRRARDRCRVQRCAGEGEIGEIVIHVRKYLSDIGVMRTQPKSIRDDRRQAVPANRRFGISR